MDTNVLQTLRYKLQKRLKRTSDQAVKDHLVTKLHRMELGSPGIPLIKS